MFRKSLHVIPIICIVPKKVLNKILLFVVNTGYEDTKNQQVCTLAYLTQAQYENYSETGENSSKEL